ncbi:MAG TPA: cbb3-type cytochrome c oxidase N-terminal domain-containing protein [Brumimicrobium sp.]|nr:cbb3-type cytochrome c oxidase N-terminal domain-containing protein [Brumimicrobium sp.]
MKAKYFLTITAMSFFSVASYAQETAQVVIVPDYDKNFKLFMGMTALLIVLLLAIYIVAKSISNLTGSDKYKAKLLAKSEADSKAGGTSAMAIVLLVGMLLFGSNAMALSFTPGTGGPWLKVENADLIWMLFINLALVGMYFYMKSVMNQLIENTLPKAEIAAKQEAKNSWFKINKILTDVVPIEEEESIIMDHEFDGIRELDNNLPPWWVALFWITIIFSIGYVLHYHVFKTGDLQIAEYEKAMEESEKKVQEYLTLNAMNVDENTATVMTESSDLSAGKILYNDNCVVCHKANGEGDIGPNLTDDYWLYSNDIKDIFKVIKSGTSKGMPEHGSRFNPIQIQQVSSYILTLEYAEGKEPEGEKM